MFQNATVNLVSVVVVFFSTFCTDSYFGICESVASMLPQYHGKDPVHSARSADGRLQVNTVILYASQSQPLLLSEAAGPYMVKEEETQRNIVPIRMSQH